MEIEVSVKNAAEKARVSAKPWVTITTNSLMGTFAMACDDTEEEAEVFLSRVQEQSAAMAKQMGLKPADTMEIVHRDTIKWVFKN